MTLPVEGIVGVLDVVAAGVGDFGDVAVAVQLVTDDLSLLICLGDEAAGCV